MVARAKDMFIRALDLRQSVPPVDFHLHTTYSDGTSSIREYLSAAAGRGLRGLCFSDHVDFTTRWFPAYREEIAAARRDGNTVIPFCGIEVRARDHAGNLNAPGAIVAGAEVVIGVVHSIPTRDGSGKCRPQDLARERLLDVEQRLALALVGNRAVTILGHPMGNYGRIHGPAPASCMREILEAAADAGTPVEINPSYFPGLAGFREFLDLCMEVNPLVSLGSDAHSAGDLGKVVRCLEDIRP